MLRGEKGGSRETFQTCTLCGYPPGDAASVLAPRGLPFRSEFRLETVTENWKGILEKEKTPASRERENTPFV